MNKKAFGAMCLAATLAITGCANTDVYKGSVYTGSQAKETRSISYGTIVSVREVKIQADAHGVIGSVGGGAIGGIAGSTLGGGRGSDIMSAVGAVVGSLLGNAIEQKASQTTALEMVIRKDSGEEIVVVQKKELGLAQGKRVRIVGNANDVNVSPL